MLSVATTSREYSLHEKVCMFLSVLSECQSNIHSKGPNTSQQNVA